LSFHSADEALDKLPESNVKIVMIDEKVGMSSHLQTSINEIGNLVLLRKTNASQENDLYILKKPIRTRNLELLLEKLTKQLTQSPPAYKSTPPRNIAPLETVYILVAEDNHMNQIIIKKLLRSLGFHDIDLVENGRDAVAAVAKKKYDIVFMDIMVNQISKTVFNFLDACDGRN
jgi:hypothetical protein